MRRQERKKVKRKNGRREAYNRTMKRGWKADRNPTETADKQAEGER